MIKKLLVTLLLSVIPAAVWAESSVQDENVHATLVSEDTAIQAGKPIRLGIILEPKEGWHTYWQNPGDAGMPTELSWTLPEGFTTSAIDWPAPQKLTEGPLVTYSYVGKVMLPVTVTPPASLKDGESYPLKVNAQWLVCKDICIPESADLDITLPAGAPAPSAFAPLFAEHDKNRPQPLPAALSYELSGRKLILEAPLDQLNVHNIKAASFFPLDQNIFAYADEQKFVAGKNLLHLTINKIDDAPIDKLSGLLSVSNDSGPHYFNVSLSASAATPDESKAPFLPLILLLAVMGGLVLNLMPCVLPVLSLKALDVVQKVGASRSEVLKQGIAYTLGIMVSFGIIAGSLIALQHAGSAVGWGYQMQSPPFVGFLIYLLFLVGLNMSGLFDLPVLLGNTGNELASEHSARGSFFTGVLATAVATPCTAPFMASAVGVALTLPAWQAMLIFEALGFGLALPFLLISIFPQLLRFLPRPGMWMETLRQFLAFPIYASVIWLLWVLAIQTGPDGIALTLCGMLLIMFVLWMKKWFEPGSIRYRLTALLILLLAAWLVLPSLGRMQMNNAMRMSYQEDGIKTVEFSPKKLEKLRSEGKPVLIDATAAWCITCQVNARVAIRTDRTMKLLKDRGVTLMVADWTNRNADITEFLRGFGYSGVPLVVYYPPDNGSPVVLPQILTEDIVTNAITQ